MNKIVEALRRLDRNPREILWSYYFHDAIKGSEWYEGEKKNIKPGRWAVGYNYLYVMYRILDEYRPCSVLEFGLGESTKLIGEYVKFSGDNTHHLIIEHDKAWKEFFQNNNQLSERSEIMIADIEKSSGRYRYNANRVKQIINDNKFDVISIDGPWGSEGRGVISRGDILPFIPRCLKKDFVIVIDDYERGGEKRMAKRLMYNLERNGIKYYTGIYCGEADVCVIASESRRWCTTM